MEQNLESSFQPPGICLFLVERFLQRERRDCCIKAKCGKRAASRRRRRIYAIQAQSLKGTINNLNNLQIIKTMKNFKKPNGTIKQFVNNQYFVELDNGNNIIISYNVMHRNVDLSAMMINGSIPPGTRMVFYFKDQDTVYPDAGTYSLKQQPANTSVEPDTAKLMEGLLPYTMPSLMDMNTFLLKVVGAANDMSPLVLQEIFVICLSERSDEEKQRKIRLLLNMSERLVDESECFERKGFMLHTAGDNPDKVDGKNMQLREIADELISFANDQTISKGVVLVGVDDDGKPTGLEKELALAYPGMSRDQFQATVITNVFSSYVKDASFMQSLRFDWRSMDDHLVCLISTNYIGLPITIGDSVMPYRSSNTKSVAKGSDMVRMIWNAGYAYARRHPNVENIDEEVKEQNEGDIKTVE